MPGSQIHFLLPNIKATTLLFVLFFVLRLAAQKRSPVNYLEQKPPGKTASLFAPGIISTDSIEHSAPAFSPDGKTVLWAIMKMPSYQTCLLEMNFANNQWSSPHTPSFSDTTANEVYPNFSMGGDSLFFSSNRKSSPFATRRNTLWYVTRIPEGWSQAKLLDTNTYKRDIYASSVSENGTRYYTVGPFRNPDWNIYKTDPFGKTDSLPSHINSRGYEDGPFIAPDEGYLIFESDRQNSPERGGDLYISFRDKNKNWAVPMNMGPQINSAATERFARVSPDGQYLFFGRNTGTGFDIYWIDASIINGLRKQAISEGLLK
ncbi:MAG: hypothetical protein V4722_25710 [Bacteroidota bacterium]